MKTYIPGQSPSTPPRRESIAAAIQAPETPSTVQRSGGVVIYALGKPGKTTALQPAPYVVNDPDVDLPLLARLSINQIRDIGRLAQLAFKAGVKAGLIDKPARGQATKAAEAWRHEQQFAAVKKRSLKACDQGDYKALEEHFAAMIPAEELRAFEAGMSKGKDVAYRQMILHKIKTACESVNLNYPGYPAHICKDQFRRSLEAASPKQLWCLFFTITKRARDREEFGEPVKSSPCSKNRPPAASRRGLQSLVPVETHDGAEYDAPF